MNNRNDSNESSSRELDRQLDELLRDAIPPAIEGGIEQKLCDNWKTLARDRHQRTKRVRSICVWATAAALLMTVGWMRIGRDGGGDKTAMPEHANEHDLLDLSPKEKLAEAIPDNNPSHESRITEKEKTQELLASSSTEKPQIRKRKPQAYFYGSDRDLSVREQFCQAILRANPLLARKHDEAGHVDRSQAIDHAQGQLPRRLQNLRLASTRFASRDTMSHQRRGALVVTVQRLPVLVQRQLVSTLSEIKGESVREYASAVILDAAGSDARYVLNAWLQKPELRTLAWQSAVQRSTPADWQGLARIAKDSKEQSVLCRRLVKDWNDGGLEMLVSLTQVGKWQPTIRTTATSLPVAVLPDLLNFLNGSGPDRTGAAALLAIADSDDMDLRLAEMIVSGRRRIAAYQALIARGTKDSQHFLSISEQRHDLSPALAAARRRWITWGPQSIQWAIKTRSPKNEDDNAAIGNASDLLAACDAIRVASQRG